MARKSTENTAEKVAALARANERLKAENSLLKTELHDHPGAFSKGWRMLLIMFCVAAATALLVVGNALFWAGDTLVNNDRYVKTVTPLLQDTAIQAAVAGYTTNKLFENVNVDQVIQNALPPRAAFLAEPLSNQVKTGTDQALKKVLASDKFQAVWARSNGKAHEQFIAAIKQSNGDGIIHLQDVYDQLSQSLSDTKLSFLAGKSLPPSVGSIEVVKATWVPTARTIINNIGWIKPVTLIGVAAFSAAAIWLSRNRRKMVIVLGSFFTAGMLVSLVTLRAGKAIIVSHTAPAYQTAADHAVHIITRTFVAQTVTLLLVGLVIVIAAWISGPYHLATVARRRIDLLLSGQLHQAIFGRRETAMTRWIGKHKLLLQWLAVAIIAAIMLLVRLSPKAVIVYVIIVILLVSIIEILAAPPRENATHS